MKPLLPKESIICGTDSMPGYSSLLVPAPLSDTFRSYLKTARVKSGEPGAVEDDNGFVAESLISVKGSMEEVSSLIDQWFKRRRWRETRREVSDAVKWEFTSSKMDNALQRKAAVQKRLSQAQAA